MHFPGTFKTAFITLAVLAIGLLIINASPGLTRLVNSAQGKLPV